MECFITRTDNYDKGIQTDAIYLDYSKCFDTVVHSKVIFLNLVNIVSKDLLHSI